MKKSILIVSFLSVLICSFFISARTKYITDSFEITLRTEPNSRAKVISMPKSGTRVETLDKNGKWTHVKISRGTKIKEGWVLTRYLESQPTAAISLIYVQKKYNKCKETIDKKKKEVRVLKGTIDSLSKNIKNTSWKLKTTESSYENLKKGSGEYLSLKADNDSTLLELNNATTIIQALTAENDRLRNDEKKQWFIIGAAVIAFGYLFGLYTGKKNKKKRY